MRLELGRPVRCSDGPFGELVDIVIDPTKKRVTHLVVRAHGLDGVSRLVPVELADPEDEGDRGFRTSVHRGGRAAAHARPGVRLPTARRVPHE